MRRAVIIGAGPAGLTAAWELLRKSDVVPLVFESEGQPGGISKTIVVNGFRMDIGGHRFFSKSEKVMKWWYEILPPAGAPAKDDIVLKRDVPVFPDGPDPEKVDEVMLIRKRLSRILFERKFYPYPLSLSLQVFKNLGVVRTTKAGVDYVLSSIFPRNPEESLEDFLINRFGKTLYELFFRDYTYKVWGKSCEEIDASWGRQRIKGLSLKKVLVSALTSILKKEEDISQRGKETSLIDYFLYPKFGPGQLWEEVAKKIEERGGKVIYNSVVQGIVWEGSKVKGVIVKNNRDGHVEKIEADFVLSSAPLKDIVLGFIPQPPSKVLEVANNLPYRDFITVGVHLRDLTLPSIEDNWIYVQEPDVKVGRLQIFNNWSPYLVPTKGGLWIGMEFFANEGDELWELKGREMSDLAISELQKLGIVKDKSWVFFTHVAKVKKAYPAYWGGYDEFYVLRDFLNQLDNYFPIGRNGMHRYNNQDHSMLSAIEAVNNIVVGEKQKDNIWLVNAEEDYHEEGKLQ